MSNWITGARGFIGRELARQLAQAGSSVQGIGHGAWAPDAMKANGLTIWLNGGITASNLSALAAASGTPETIFHLAGGSSVGAALAQPREDFSRTVNATSELLEWVRLEAPRASVVVISSAAVYGAGHAQPIGEGAAPNPYSPYGTHKLAMELLCASYGASFGVRSVIGRVFSAYGPGLRKQILWDTCCRLERGERHIELAGSGEELRDFVHVRDVARVVAALPVQASAEARAVNIGSGHGTSVRALVTLLMECWAAVTGEEYASISFSGRSRAGDPRYLVADVSHLASLGLRCTLPIASGVSEYIDWFRGRQTEAD